MASLTNGWKLFSAAALTAAMLFTAVPAKAEAIPCSLDRAKFYRSQVFEDMNRLRQTADELETLCSSEYWPYPSYGDLLFSIK